MSRLVPRWLATLAMIAPLVRVLVRRVHGGRGPAPRPIVADVDGSEVVVPHGPGDATVDGRPVGVTDVRLDVGTSTIEAWSQVGAAQVEHVVRAVTEHAAATGVRRVAWVVAADTPEAASVRAAGFEHEGVGTAPIGRSDAPLEVWARVLA